MYSLPWPAGSYQIWGFPQFLHDHSLAAELHLILNHQTQNEVFVSSSLEKKFTDKSDPSHMYFTSENLKSSCHLPHSQVSIHWPPTVEDARGKNYISAEEQSVLGIVFPCEERGQKGKTGKIYFPTIHLLLLICTRTTITTIYQKTRHETLKWHKYAN